MKNYKTQSEQIVKVIPVIVDLVSAIKSAYDRFSSSKSRQQKVQMKVAAGEDWNADWVT